MGRVLMLSNSRAARRKGESAVLLLTAILSLGLTVASAEQIKKKFSTGPNPSLLLHNHNGSVSVKSWEQNEIEIQGNRSSDAMEVLITGGEQKVTVQTHPPRAHLSPEESRVTFEIRVPRQATIRVDAERGDVAVEKVQGDVTIEGVSTAVSLADLRGHIAVRTVDGPIRIRSSEGHIEAHSFSGDVEFFQVNGAELVASTNSGGIRYEGDFGLGGTYVLNNYSSPIRILTSEQASFDLTARAVQGMIENSLSFRPIPLGNAFRRLPPNKFLQGRFNSGKSTVQVTSYSGTIQLQGRRP